MSENQASSTVVIVDDTLLFRLLVSQAVDSIDGFQVIGQADNGVAGLEAIAKLKPDIVLTDLEMPVMDGLELLSQLRVKHPGVKPMVISSISTSGAKVTLDALHLGALDFITKPEADDAKQAREQLVFELERKLPALTSKSRRPSIAAAPTKPGVSGSRGLAGAAAADNGASTVMSEARSVLNSRRISGIFVGVSTGGPVALAELLPRFNVGCPPVFIVQHMPGPFISSLAEKLDKESTITVLEARDGATAEPSHAYIAPGGTQMGIERNARRTIMRLSDAPPENHCQPSASYLLRSAAGSHGRSAIGIILTGMGNDGADGLLDMRNAGAITIAQDEESCTVFGMPKQALKVGAASFELPLGEIAALIGGS